MPILLPHAEIRSKTVHEGILMLVIHWQFEARSAFDVVCPANGAPGWDCWLKFTEAYLLVDEEDEGAKVNEESKSCL